MSTTDKLNTAIALLRDAVTELRHIDAQHSYSAMERLASRIESEISSEYSGIAATYNGYTNYETWSVALIIDNDSNETIKDAIRQALQDSDGAALREWVESWPDLDATLTNRSEWPQTYGSLSAQLLGSALDEVNWRELRDNYAEQASDWGISADEDE